MAASFEDPIGGFVAFVGTIAVPVVILIASPGALLIAIVEAVKNKSEFEGASVTVVTFLQRLVCCGDAESMKIQTICDAETSTSHCLPAKNKHHWFLANPAQHPSLPR